MYRLPHGVHVSPVQRHSARPRGAMPQGARPQVVTPCGGHARRGSGRGQYDFEPHGSDISFYPPSGPCFPRGDRYLPNGPHFPFHGDRFASWPWMIFQLTLFLNKWSNTSMIHSLITPVLSQLPILCLSIEQFRGLENI